MIRTKKYLPGLSIAFGLAILASFIGPMIKLGAVITALVLGMIVGNSLRSDLRFAIGMRFADKVLLEVAIVLIGLSLSFAYLENVRPNLWFAFGLSIVVVTAVGYIISRLRKGSRGMGILLGVGTAICGTAAIAAISPLLTTDEEETGISIAVINLMGTIGLFVLPLILITDSYDPQSVSLILGGSLPSVGHVTGAGYALGDEIGKLALIFKMARILWIIPVVLGVYLVLRNKEKRATGKVKLPVFILFFLMSVGIAQWKLIPLSLKDGLVDIGDFLLIVSMAAIGFKIRIASLVKRAKPALILGTILFVLQIVAIVLINIGFKI